MNKNGIFNNISQNKDISPEIIPPSNNSYISNNSISSFSSNISQSSLPRGLKITSWILFLISLIFSILFV